MVENKKYKTSVWRKWTSSVLNRKSCKVFTFSCNFFKAKGQAVSCEKKKIFTLRFIKFNEYSNFKGHFFDNRITVGS